MEESKVVMNKRRKRKAIVDAAIELFSLKGFHKTKTVDIAKKARVAEGTIYLYFKSKDILLVSAYKEVIEEMIAKIKEKNSTEKRAMHKIKNFIDEHIELLKNNETLARFIVVESRQSPDFYNNYPEFRPLGSYVSYLKSIIDEAIEKKEFRPIDSNVLVSIIYGSIDVILTRWFLLKEDTDFEQISAEATNIMLLGLRPQKK